MNFFTTLNPSFNLGPFGRGGYRLFTCTSPRMENRYVINGTEWTRTSVLAVSAEERTIAQWSILIDWDLQRRRNFVIVDPLDPTGILYLNHAEYLAQSKVCASNDLTLFVLARPGTKPPVPSSEPSSSSQNSPWGVEIEEKWGRDSHLSWKLFLKLRANVAKLVNRKGGSAMVSETKESLVRSVLLWTRELAHYAELRNPETYGALMVPLVSHLQKLIECNGRMAVVLHLKLSLFALYSYISGNPIKSTTPLGWGIRLRTCGLPRCWSKQIVEAIKSDRISVVRLMASLLNLYKAMEAPHPDFSVASIVKPHPDLTGKDWDDFIKFSQEVFPRLLRGEMKKNGCKYPPFFKYLSQEGYLLVSAGANLSAPSVVNIVQDAKAWASQPKNHALDWFKLHGDERMAKLMEEVALEAHWTESTVSVPNPQLNPAIMASMSEAGRAQFAAMFPPTTSVVHDRSGVAQTFMATRASHLKNKEFFKDGAPIPFLGRLHAIDEPAGKVRVVAICDYFTQVALKPVHDHLMHILSFIGTDATFDQTGVTERYFKRGLSPHWSFDLKTATDTIPLALYKEVLRPLLKIKGEVASITEDRVNLWAKIATDRDFVTPDGITTVRYGTGQPMGALSSWASMAIVHHSLVQFAAWKQGRANYQWYQDYLVLGDDIDIARSEAVANSYQSTCQSFQIIIGLIKSLRSNKNCFEFANQRFYPGGNISPISFKEELQAQSWMSRLEFAKRILVRFGTSLKDEASALILKASTSAQWKVVVPERHGVRPLTIFNLVRFCLLTPFQGKEVRIDSVLEWIAPILTSKDRVELTKAIESANLKRDLETGILQPLLRDLLSLARKLLKSIPTPYQTVKILEPSRLKVLLEMVRDVHIGGITEDLSGKACVSTYEKYITSSFSAGLTRDGPKGGRIATLYIMRCIALHNAKIKKDLTALLKELEAFEQEISTKVGLDMAFMYSDKMPDSYPSPTMRIFGFWDRLISIPSVITPDFNKPASRWMVGEPTETNLQLLFNKKSDSYRNRVLQERLRAPMASISLAIAKVLGVTIPLIPYHVRRTGGNWSQSIKAAIAAFNQARLAQEALQASGPESVDSGVVITLEDPTTGTNPD